jgi:hypothetical protein
MIGGYPFVQQPPDPAFQQIFQELAQAGNAPNASRLGWDMRGAPSLIINPKKGVMGSISLLNTWD